MKKIVILSATSKSNLDLANNLQVILKKLGPTVKLVNLEEYSLPLYSTAREQEGPPAKVFDLSNKLVESDGLVICSPEYNGSIPPVVTNAIAWISVTTKNWREGFQNKKAVIASSSGGLAGKYVIAMKNQLEHLGVVVMPRTITITNSSPLNQGSAKKIIKSFLKYLSV